MKFHKNLTHIVYCLFSLICWYYFRSQRVANTRGVFPIDRTSFRWRRTASLWISKDYLYVQNITMILNVRVQHRTKWLYNFFRGIHKNAFQTNFSILRWIRLLLRLIRQKDFFVQLKREIMQWESAKIVKFELLSYRIMWYMSCYVLAYVPNGKLTFKIIVNEFKKLLVLYILFFNVLNTYFLKNRNITKIGRVWCQLLISKCWDKY